MSKAILYDATQCIGCQECEGACARENRLPYNDNIAKERKTSEHKFTAVQFASGDRYMRRLCMHCQDPTCVSVCPVGALEKTKNGPVVYDEHACMGCRYCMTACPFGVPKYEWSAVIPRVRKCVMCSERLAKGLPTACSEACPTGATKTGERSALLAEAQQRIRDNPKQYINHVFGLSEVGGTSVLLLSGSPFEEFGFAAQYPQQPLPKLTYAALSKVPDVASLGFVLLGGIWWITNRRNEVAAAEHAERTGPKPSPEPTSDEGEES